MLSFRIPLGLSVLFRANLLPLFMPRLRRQRRLIYCCMWWIRPNPAREEQIAEVDKVLSEIGASEVRQLLVLNKLDLTGLPAAVERGEYDRITRVRVSAKCGDGLPILRDALKEIALEKLRDTHDQPMISGVKLYGPDTLLDPDFLS